MVLLAALVAAIACTPDAAVSASEVSSPIAPTPPTAAVMSLPAPSTSLTPDDFTIAFIGDQGMSAGSKAVLDLVREEGADMVLHQGDLGYSDNADAWDQMISHALGRDFPYFASVGNHDCSGSSTCDGPGLWDDYQAKLQARLDRISGASCIGDLGVNAACSYRGIFFVLSGIGTLGSDHLNFLTEALASDASTWRICSWHRNQALMQVGTKSDEVGWEVYDACRSGGAIVATGHEHSYSRTHLMASFESQTVVATSNTLVLEHGASFAFVSGLGGYGARSEREDLSSNPWWGSVYAGPEGAAYGALFCAFNYRSVAESAYCYFKAVDGTIADEFDIVAP